MPPRSQFGDEPCIGAFEPPAPEGGQETGPNHRGLAAPARSDDGEEARPRARTSPPLQQSLDERLPSEEVVRVCFVEWPKALVGVPCLEGRGQRDRHGARGERVADPAARDTASGKRRPGSLAVAVAMTSSSAGGRSDLRLRAEGSCSRSCRSKTAMSGTF